MKDITQTFTLFFIALGLGLYVASTTPGFGLGFFTFGLVYLGGIIIESTARFLDEGDES